MDTQHTQNQTFRLGTRRSPLAMAQAEETRDRLARAHEIDPAHIEIVAVTASGDRIQDRPLAEIGGKALWTKELDAWLDAGEIDFAVHSAKDVETLRRMMTPNGKIQGRKRTGLNAREQRIAAQAIKRARYMGLLPYTSATL